MQRPILFILIAILLLSFVVNIPTPISADSCNIEHLIIERLSGFSLGSRNGKARITLIFEGGTAQTFYINKGINQRKLTSLAANLIGKKVEVTYVCDILINLRRTGVTSARIPGESRLALSSNLGIIHFI